MERGVLKSIKAVSEYKRFAPWPSWGLGAKWGGWTSRIWKRGDPRFPLVTFTPPSKYQKVKNRTVTCTRYAFPRSPMEIHFCRIVQFPFRETRFYFLFVFILLTWRRRPFIVDLTFMFRYENSLQPENGPMQRFEFNELPSVMDFQTALADDNHNDKARMMVVSENHTLHLYTEYSRRFTSILIIYNYLIGLQKFWMTTCCCS